MKNVATERSSAVANIDEAACFEIAPDDWAVDSSPYPELANELGALVADKCRQYGHSPAVVADVLRLLYPEGIPPAHYDDALLLTRIADKMCRIATRRNNGKDLGGESPYRDIAGYGLMGVHKDGP